ncbi:glycoside hydrolase family 3 C-terminal domain-containing protein [Streptomyces sp. NPDC048643]|uniref:glycoside hydrolase family 3 C-terminal domain-containing protein n=1 Tax=Streptomyces sp. NPDC048643 TaxID=3155637 RepID=UPI00342954C9
MSRKRWLSAAMGGALVAAGIAGQVGAAAPARASTLCPWVGSTATVPDRVSQLLGAMSQDQKLSMVAGNGDAYAGVVPAIPSLCVPELDLSDGPSGVGQHLTGVTQLPSAVSAAATWDIAAMQKYGAVVGKEQAGKGSEVDLGPTVNLVRDPRFGRAFETLGEDPYLAGAMGTSHIRGVQSQGVMAQLKHMAVYNQETYRNSSDDNAIVDERTLQEQYLPAFETAVKDGAPSSVMCSYSTVNGTYACQNKELLTNVLRDQFDFKGYVTSDWGGTHAGADSANAGMDMEMGSRNYYGTPLRNALADGTVKQATLNTMASRILTEMFTFGLFDKAPTGSKATQVSTADHVATGLQVAEQGSVLLKNSDKILPLTPAKGSSVAVLGSWQNSGGGSASVHADSVVSPQQGIASRAGSDVNVQYVQGSASASALATVPASVVTPSSGGGSGLTGRFYNNTTLSGDPVLTKNISTLDEDWDGGSPGSGVNSTNWSAKWTGTLKAPATGVYTFATNSDDGSRVIVEGKKIVDQWGDQQATTAAASVKLTAGQSVPVEIDYYNKSGGSGLTFSWTPADYTTSAIRSAVDLARRSSVAVVFAKADTSEGSDLKDIELPGDQNQLIAQVAAANPHTVVVLNTGSAVTMPWLDGVDGVLESWYAGQSEGTAIASLLFGDVNPSGKLPVTFPKSLTDVPARTAAQWPGQGGTVQYSEGLAMGYRWYQSKGIAPLFPFGYGLSYTSFAYSDLHVTGPDTHGNSTVTATVKNTGSRAGADVPQLYVTAPAATGEPGKQLRGFQRVDLQPGASKEITFSVPMRALSTWNTSAVKWTATTGTYGIAVGNTSDSPQLNGSVKVDSTATGNSVEVDNPVGMSSAVGTGASLTLRAIDSASGQTLRWSATGLPSGLTISSTTGKISGSAASAGTSTVTVTATDGTGAAGKATFVWTTTPTARTGPIVSGLLSSLCLDDKAADTTDGNPITLYPCNGSAAQEWTVSGDTLQVLGKCLDVAAAGTANKTLVQLYACNGTGAQVWQARPDGTLRNPASGRCLDVPAASTTPGTRLQIFDCNATGAQKWKLP